MAESMSWYNFRELLMRKFCTATELVKLEREFLEHKMVGADHAGYTTRFNELSRLVPHLVNPESKSIEKYLRGLIPQVRSTMAAVRPLTLEEAILRSEAMTEELVQCGTIVAVGTKRKESGETSSNKKVWRNNGKRQNTGKLHAVTETSRKEYTGVHPKCAKCNFIIQQTRFVSSASTATELDTRQTIVESRGHKEHR